MPDKDPAAWRVPLNFNSPMSRRVPLAFVVPAVRRAPPNFVYIIEAAHRLGRARYRDDWPAILAEGREAFDLILRTLAEACEAKTVAAFYEWSVGDLRPLEPAAWHGPDWQEHILSGQILLEQKRCLILVREPDLAQLDAKLKAEHGTKPEGVPSEAPKHDTDKRQPRKRGPKRARYAELDRKLFPALERIMNEKGLSAHVAARELVKQIAPAGPTTNDESKIKRLAERWRKGTVR